MEDGNWIEIGPTKMIAIEISQFVPASKYFASVLCLFEFTALGQIIPARIDIMPYRLSPFSSYKNDITQYLDAFKFVLNLYNIKSITD